MSRKQPKRRAGRLAHAAIAGFFILVIAGGVGFGAASANSSDDLERAGAFGFDEATHQATLSAAVHAFDSPSSGEAPEFDQSALASASLRDITSGLRMVDQREAAEKARREAENAAALERVALGKSKQGVESAQKKPAPAGETAKPQAEETMEQGRKRSADAPKSSDSPKASDAPDTPSTLMSAEAAEVAEAAEAAEMDAPQMEYDLPAVDWTVGKEAFLKEWTRRIDAYLEGSPLSGYGSVFAEAAWDNGVDPRWSPAISNTESTKGAHCFLPHNAWGWGASSWADWSSAIREHVTGLATVYGYSLTPNAAAVYCPPNHVNWYNTTLSQMATM